MVELIDNYIKIAIITIFHMFKEIEERLSVLIRDMKYTEKTQIKLVEMKTAMYEMKKIHWMGLIAGFYIAKGNIYKLEDRAAKTTQRR